MVPLLSSVPRKVSYLDIVNLARYPGSSSFVRPLELAGGAGGFAAVGLAAVVMNLPFLYNYLPLGQFPGAISSSGAIALISFFVGLEVAAAFVLIVGELLEQTLLRSA